VAAALLKGRGWLLTVAVVVTAMVLLAVLGTDRQQMLQDHQASGTMRDLAVEQISTLQVTAGARQWQLQRGPTGWTAAPPVAAAGAELDGRVEAALRLLRNAAPEREFEGIADADAAAFGLAPPRLNIRVHATAEAASPVLFEIGFGVLNPMGLAHYARVTQGRRVQTLLLPSYVAEAWDSVLAAR